MMNYVLLARVINDATRTVGIYIIHLGDTLMMVTFTHIFVDSIYDAGFGSFKLDQFGLSLQFASTMDLVSQYVIRLNREEKKEKIV